MPEVDPDQTESKPPIGGGSDTAMAFGAGVVVGIGLGFLLATSVCNRGPELAANTGPTTGAVVQVSPDSGTALPPPQETAPAEPRPQ